MVRITVDDCADRSPAEFQREVNGLRDQLTSFQQRLQTEERLRLDAESQMRFVTKKLLPMMEKAMSGPKQIVNAKNITGGHFGDSIHGPDLEEVRRLVETMQQQQADVEARATEDEAVDLREAVADLRAQGEAEEPDKSALRRSVEVVQRIAEETATAGLGEAAKKLASLLFG